MLSRKNRAAVKKRMMMMKWNIKIAVVVAVKTKIKL
jgi:hypothetical protein